MSSQHKPAVTTVHTDTVTCSKSGFDRFRRPCAMLADLEAFCETAGVLGAVLAVSIVCTVLMPGGAG